VKAGRKLNYSDYESETESGGLKIEFTSKKTPYTITEVVKLASIIVANEDKSVLELAT
jgi:hypothetical protein